MDLKITIFFNHFETISKASYKNLLTGFFVSAYVAEKMEKVDNNYFGENIFASEMVKNQHFQTYKIS